MAGNASHSQQNPQQRAAEEAARRQAEETARRAAEEAARRERERVAAIQNQINGLNNLKNHYISAKQEIEGIRNHCEQTVQNWKSKHGTYRTHVSEIYWKNEFEGEIARRFSQYAAELQQALGEGTHKGDQLTYALNRQINVINLRISGIDSEISRLRSQI